MKQTKKYFETYIRNPVAELVYMQKVYKDFQQNCILNKFNVDPFTKFVDKIYYKAIITDICRLLDSPSSHHKDDRNFRGFIELFKCKENKILEKRRKVSVIDIGRGRIKKIDASKYIEPMFNKAEHDKKIEQLEKLFKSFKSYRHKINCHQTSTKVKPPSYKKIDKTISILEELTYMYAKLFGSCIISFVPDLVYNNPLFSKNFTQRKDII